MGIWVNPCIHLAIHRSIHPSAHLSIWPSIYHSILAHRVKCMQAGPCTHTLNPPNSLSSDRPFIRRPHTHMHVQARTHIYIRCTHVHRARWSVPVVERLALPTSDHGVAGSNPARGEILPEPKRRFIAQSLSCSPFHHLEMTEILLKGRKTLSHLSIYHLPCPVAQLAARQICNLSSIQGSWYRATVQPNNFCGNWSWDIVSLPLNQVRQMSLTDESMCSLYW